MDLEPDPVGKRIRELTGELGILPNDPLGPILEELAKLPDQVSESIDDRLDPFLKRLETVSSNVSDRTIDSITDKISSEATWKVTASVDRLVEAHNARAIQRTATWMTIAILGAIVFGIMVGATVTARVMQ